MMSSGDRRRQQHLRVTVPMRDWGVGWYVDDIECYEDGSRVEVGETTAAGHHDCGSDDATASPPTSTDWGQRELISVLATIDIVDCIFIVYEKCIFSYRWEWSVI